MAAVITETDIRKFEGMSRAVLPLGAILTPTAKDWAFEHHLELSFEPENNRGFSPAVDGGNEKDALLRCVVKSVVNQVDRNGTPVSNDTLVTIVITCLERMGFQVK